VESYKTAADRDAWAREKGLTVLGFYNKLLSEGYSVNSARSYLAIRAFARDLCTQLKIPKGKIAKPQRAIGQQIITLTDLQKTFAIADSRMKALLSVSISGLNIGQILELRREFLEPYVNRMINEKVDFLSFDLARTKTLEEAHIMLTPEIRDCLRAFWNFIDAKRTGEGLAVSEWVFPSGNGSHMDEDTANKQLKKLFEEAQIVVTGKVSFHTIRKFMMSTLSRSGFNAFEVKRCLGKSIGVSDETYLTTLNDAIDEKYPSAYQNLRLSGNGNGTKLRVEQLQAENEALKSAVSTLQAQYQVMSQILTQAIPKKTLRNVVRKIRKDLGLKDAKTQAEFFQTEDFTIETLVKDVSEQKKTQKEQKEESNGE